VRQEGHDFDDVHRAGHDVLVRQVIRLRIGRGFAHGKDEYKRRVEWRTISAVYGINLEIDDED